MTYYLSKVVKAPFEAAVTRTRGALAAEGFGVISEIDIRRTLAEKIGVEFRPYTILGACNPRMAHEALQIEDKVGTLLPCNVVVQDLGDGRSEVAAIDPVASMQAIANEALTAKAAAVREKLRQAIDRI